ncbi:damage-control phosphatase ARMT1-like isoform X2 [Plodia interpunctella]|uniref:damage-control phosphatase ARMT1-like isoform X2 n=1 Tax=Plodia interpunctella TaxID=58824 RepID=UPI002367F23F|nr:damage-control phosphatase ARMT1-like isoform X2 [Plodia interpunctella]
MDHKSFGYISLIDRLPRIINKIIENCSTEGSKIKSACNASDDDLKNYIQHLKKIINDLVTNQCYELLTVDTTEARKWNAWIESQNNPRYFTNIWLYSECYVYRRIREAGELNNGLASFDPFEDQKAKAFEYALQLKCVVAEKLAPLLTIRDKKSQRDNFLNLLKLCLWSNQAISDLSLTDGDVLDADSGAGSLDPFKTIEYLKDQLIADHSEKIVDYVIAKTESLAKCSGGERADGKSVMFDIVCDNSGYELFTDLCLAHFLLSQKIVQKVRFHVKDIPWFVSDVTPKDFKYVINACREAKFNKTVTGPEPLSVSSESLNNIAGQWQQLVDEGAMLVLHDDFWTSPHMYKDMKKYDPSLYTKLQDAIAVMFKGDLNCRKLLNEVNWPTTTSFDNVLLGFHPTPVISVRTVKSDLVCGLPPGKAELLSKLDEKWMQKGDYGIILFSEKIEPLQRTGEN